MHQGTPSPAQAPLVPAAPPSEIQSSLTLMDFLAGWHRLRGWFVGGLLIVGLGTIIWNKLFMMKYYRAEARIFVGRAIPMEQRIGFSDLEAPAVGRNDQFLNLVQGVLAEQTLTSTRLLLEVADRLKSGYYASTGITTRWDLYALLKIRERDEAFRQAKLAQVLRDSLIQVRQLQNSGALLFSVELPDPVAAQNFTNACIRDLQESFTKLEFDYYDAALKDYRRRLDREVRDSERLAGSRVDLDLDKYPPRAQQNEIVKAELDHQATWIAEINTKISKLDMATTDSAKIAAQPVKVIDYATVPIKKIRPQTILNTLMAMALYTFVFMLGLAAAGYLRWSQATRRPEA